MAKVSCFEYKGTGSAASDCPCCQGTRTIRVKAAYALGWQKRDLVNVDPDGTASCPECYDDAEDCMFCRASGRVSPFVAEQQRNRVLVTARYGKRIGVACSFKIDATSKIDVDRNISLLSATHAEELAREGLIIWSNDVLGDTLHLTAAGLAASTSAFTAYAGLYKRFIRDNRKRRVEAELVSAIIDLPRVAEEAF